MLGIGRYQLRCHSRLDELAALRDEWNELAADIPFCRWDWLEAWWRVYSPLLGLVELAVVTVRDADQRLVGLAPWYVDRTRSRGGRIQSMGAGEVCSEYVTVLARDGEADNVGRLLAEWLLSAHRRPASPEKSPASPHDIPPRWTALALSGIGPKDRAVRALVDRLSAERYLTIMRPGVRCWRIGLPSSWTAFRSRLSKSHRKQLVKLERRMFATGRARLHLVASLEDLSQALKILADLHNRRRMSLGDAGRFSSQPFVAFHNEVAKRLFTAGQLRLTWLEVDHVPVAAEYQFRGKQTIYAYQSGIEPAALDLEPGRLITMATLQSAIDEQASSLDLLRGDERYKPHWRALPIDLVDISILQPTWANRGRHVADVVVASAKRFVKRRIKSIAPVTGGTAASVMGKSRLATIPPTHDNTATTLVSNTFQEGS